MENAYFITATGTDSGKTYVAEGLARAWSAQGRRVRVLKPVLSGYVETAPEQCDAGRLLRACGRPATARDVAAIAPWRFAAPLSPDRAAALEGRHIDVDALVDWCRAAYAECAEHAAAGDIMLLEGVGGVMVPLDERRTVRDWIAALRLPTLLVAGTYLGAISHTLTALAALREAGVRPAALILNETAGSPVSLADTRASLAAHVGDLPLAELARHDSAGIERLAALLAAGRRAV